VGGSKGMNIVPTEGFSKDGNKNIAGLEFKKSQSISWGGLPGQKQLNSKMNLAPVSYSAGS